MKCRWVLRSGEFLFPPAANSSRFITSRCVHSDFKERYHTLDWALVRKEKNDQLFHEAIPPSKFVADATKWTSGNYWGVGAFSWHAYVDEKTLTHEAAEKCVRTWFPTTKGARTHSSLGCCSQVTKMWFSARAEEDFFRSHPSTWKKNPWTWFFSSFFHLVHRQCRKKEKPEKMMGANKRLFFHCDEQHNASKWWEPVRQIVQEKRKF